MSGTSSPRLEWALLGNHVLLVAHAIRRHPLVFLGVWVGVVGVSLGLARSLPKTYDVDTSLQVSPANAITALSAARAGPTTADAPSRFATETVFRRENLEALVRQTRLVEEWPKTRYGLMKLKDALFARVFKAPTEEERVDALVGLLEKRLWVNTEDTVVTIGIHFPDPQLAYLLVDTALENFMEARQVAEISTIEDAITILESKATEAHERLDEALKALLEKRESRADRLGTRVRVSPRAVSTLDASLDRESSRLVVQIQSKRRAIADLEETRRKRISELETRLQEQRSLYAENHPVVIDLRPALETARADSPQLLALRRELGPLETELKQRGLLPDVGLKRSRARDAAVTAAALTPNDSLEDLDPDIDYAKSRLVHALSTYNGLLDRVDAARLQLDGAQVAFKYRYMVLQPPQKPRAPARPKQMAILLASVLAGFVVACMTPAAIDLGSRRVLERWQVEHVLGLPVLGELRDG